MEKNNSPQKGRKIFANYSSDRWQSFFNTQRTRKLNIKKTKSPIKKYPKELKRKFSKDMQMHRKHFKMWSASLVSCKWKQLESSTSSSQSSCHREHKWQQMLAWVANRKQALTHCPLYTTAEIRLEISQRLKPKLPHGPARPLPCICPKDFISCYTDTCPSTLIAAPFTTARNGTQPISINRWMDRKNTAHIHNGMYQALKKNEIIKFTLEKSYKSYCKPKSKWHILSYASNLILYV